MFEGSTKTDWSYDSDRVRLIVLRAGAKHICLRPPKEEVHRQVKAEVDQTPYLRSQTHYYCYLLVQVAKSMTQNNFQANWLMVRQAKKKV